MKIIVPALAILLCLCATSPALYDGDSSVSPPPYEPAPGRITPIDNHGDPGRPAGVYIQMHGSPSPGRPWAGDARSIVYSMRGARIQERNSRGLSGRDRYLLQHYPTPEAYARIAPTWTR